MKDGARGVNRNRVIRAIALAAGLVGAGALAPSAFAEEAAAIDEVDPGQHVSSTIVDLAAWVIASGDNRKTPFAIIDKRAAQVLIFDAKGRLKGLAPVLIGSAEGDITAFGIVDRELKDIPMKDRTTPSGRFYGSYGPAAGGQRVLWVDFDSAVSMHPIAETNRTEQRDKRLSTPEPDDNRITHGCINVSKRFYDELVQPMFAKGGVFYVIPDYMPIEEAFPGFREQRRVASASNGNATGPAILATWDMSHQR
jgi:hypothetical protein